MGLTGESDGLAPADLERLMELSQLVGVSGDEGSVRELVRSAVEKAVDLLRVDALGNLIVHVSTGRGPRVMLAAHMDEVGFMITEIEDGGWLRFEKVGGLDTRYLPGAPVWIGGERRPGVIGIKPIHLGSSDERRSYPDPGVLRVDLGLTSREAARQVVQVGDTGTFATRCERQGDRLWGKALDDRVGVATLVRLLLDPPPGIELIGAFTAQEEIGLRGARVAAQSEAPDLAVVLDCTPARDLPGLDGRKNQNYNVRFEGGAAVHVADSRSISHPRLVRLLEETASNLDLPLQRRQPGGGGTDAGAIQRSGTGVPTVSLSVPARHLHSPAAHIRLAAWEESCLLLSAALQRVPGVWDEISHH